MREAILDHHRIDEALTLDTPPGDRKSTLLAVIALADHVEHAATGRPPAAQWGRARGAVLDHLGLSDLDFTELFDDMRGASPLLLTAAQRRPAHPARECVEVPLSAEQSHAPLLG
jgi:hypothetical protein